MSPKRGRGRGRGRGAGSSSRGSTNAAQKISVETDDAASVDVINKDKVVYTSEKGVDKKHDGVISTVEDSNGANETVVENSVGDSKESSSKNNNISTNIDVVSKENPNVTKKRKEVNESESPQPSSETIDKRNDTLLAPTTKKAKIDDAIPPNVTLYINNLNDQINSTRLRENLFLLFSTYGDIIDLSINPRDKKMRGQAHVTFANINSANLALRSLQGDSFFGKPIRIQFSINQTKKIALL